MQARSCSGAACKVALNRAVALAEVQGPAVGLAAFEELRSAGLDGYYLFHAARADLLRRLGRDVEAAAAYDAARALCRASIPRRPACSDRLKARRAWAHGSARRKCAGRSEPTTGLPSAWRPCAERPPRAIRARRMG